MDLKYCREESLCVLVEQRTLIDGIVEKANTVPRYVKPGTLKRKRKVFVY